MPRYAVWINVRVPPWLAEAIEEAAREVGAKRSDLVRVAIYEYLQRHFRETLRRHEPR